MKTEVKVGIFFVAALAILLVVFEFLDDIPFLTNEYSLKTYFESVGELRVGNPVKLAGVVVGEVNEIEIADGKIQVVFDVKDGTPVKKDSVASIRLTSLLGTSYIYLSHGSPESPLAPPGYILESEDPADVNEILAKVDSAVSSIESAASSFKVLGEENKEKLSNIVNNLDIVLADLSEGKGTLGKLLKDDALYTDARETLSEAKGVITNFNQITSSIRSGEGTLGKLITDESLYNETKRTMKGLGNLAVRLNEAEGTFGKLLNDDKLYDEAAEAATNLNSILKKIDRGEGALGKFVNEDDIYFDAKNAIKKVEQGVDTQQDLAPLNTLGTAIGVITLF